MLIRFIYLVWMFPPTGNSTKPKKKTPVTPGEKLLDQEMMIELG